MSLYIAKELPTEHLNTIETCVYTPILIFVDIEIWKKIYFLLKFSGLQNSPWNLDKFQVLSTYDFTLKTGDMWLLLECKILWIFETGKMSLLCIIWTSVIFW